LPFQDTSLNSTTATVSVPDATFNFIVQRDTPDSRVGVTGASIHGHGVKPQLWVADIYAMFMCPLSPFIRKVRQAPTGHVAGLE
jgi:hypothetical protein